MVNNRVFEALACGAAVAMVGFPEAESMFGVGASGQGSLPVVAFANSAEALPETVDRLLSDPWARERMGREGAGLVRAQHTYDNRAQAVLDTFDSIASS
jgi:spore maturation protein CgeB